MFTQAVITCSVGHNVFRANLKTNINLLALSRILLARLFIWRELAQCNYIGAIVKAKLK